MFEGSQIRLLVTGASGQLGRRVVEILLEAGVVNLVATTRRPESLVDLAARGLEVRRVDFDDPATLDEAFRNIDRALIISTDAIGIPGQRRRQHQAAVDALMKRAVGRIVYTSMPNPEPGSLIPFAPDHYETERAIAATALPYTILRVNWYAENLLAWLPQALASGVWTTAAGNGRAGYVARGDVARAAAAALTSAEAANRPIDITGPQALTVEEIAAIAREVSGRPLMVEAVSDEQLTARLTAAGLPAPLVELFVAMDANTRAGGVDVVTDAVQQLTGTPPRSLKEFLSETLSKGVQP